MSTKHFVRIGVACMLLAGCKPPQPTYLAQPEVIQAQGAYVHGPSGMTFPTTVGDFQRASITRYDAAGQDMGAGYNLLAPGWAVAATVYVYPAPSLISIGSPSDVVASARATLCKTEFERRKGELIGAHPGARQIGEKDAPLPQGGPPLPGKMAAFEYDDLFAGARLPLHSELYVFCYVGGKWAFEYRFTSPRNFAATEAIAALMMKLPWTVPPGS